FRRSSWHMDFIYQLSGIAQSDEQMHVEFRNSDGTTDFSPAAMRVNGRIGLDRTIFAEDFDFLRDNADTTAKLTIPSPSMVHYRGGRAQIDPSVYPDEDGFWADLSAAFAEQVRRIAERGCRYLQLDDTSLAYLNDPRQRRMIADRGEDAEHQHERYVRQI